MAAEVTAARGDIVLEHLGGWSNTGYLQLAIRRDDLKSSDVKDIISTQDGLLNVETDEPGPDLALIDDSTVPPTGLPKDQNIVPDVPRSPMVKKALDGYSTRILAVDSKHHLVGLKRQRGGIGRSAHDESQKKLDGFFKKQRTG